MLTLFFELYYYLLPKFAFLFEFMVGGVFYLFAFPSLAIQWLQTTYGLENPIVFDGIFLIYYILIVTIGLVFLVQSIKYLPQITRRTQATFSTFTYKQWLGLGSLVFLILFPLFVITSNSDTYYTGGDILGSTLITLLLFCVVAGHAAVVSLLLLAIGRLCQYLIHKYKPLLRIYTSLPGWVGKTVTAIVVLYPLLAGVSSIGWFLTDGMNNPQAGRFFVINAAIKNTCFIDPTRTNCPHTLTEISYIEPTAFQDMTKCCQVNYMYHPENNQYSLVVRYAPTRAVVFDWRLTSTIGVDFQEYEVSLIGQDRLVNPPAWDGPWEFSDWSYL